MTSNNLNSESNASDLIQIEKSETQFQVWIMDMSLKFKKWWLAHYKTLKQIWNNMKFSSSIFSDMK